MFNACSVGTPEKRTEIADFIIDLCVDVLFLTETWLRQAGDEAKCADLAPPGFTAKSFPRSSRGGGLAIVLKDSLLPHFSWTTSLPFCHTSFELIHATLTLTQKTLHFYTLYRPPPNRKNKLTDSLFFEQFPDLLEHCNSLAGNSFILGDFNFHYDCPLNPYTSRLNDLLSMFDLQQSVNSPTHKRGHILDWFVHRPADGLLLSTEVSQAISSDHFCVLAYLDVTIPQSPPTFVEARNIRAVHRPTLKEDLRSHLSALSSPSAVELDSTLRTVLDKHAPATQRKVSTRRSCPWYSAVSEELRAAKRERRKAERRWLSTGLTVHKQVYNAAKRHVTRLVQAAKTSFFSTKIMESKSSKQLFNITNQLASRKKPSALPTVYPPVQLPQRFADFFLSKVQTIRHNLDNQAQLVCFGESEEQSVACSLSSFRPVSEDDVRKMILKSSPKSCELDPMPTSLLFECIDEVVPA
ncbi:endonuclease/exonuclease/phosphatase family protein, partial [Thiolapillus sp.]